MQMQTWHPVLCELLTCMHPVLCELLTYISLTRGLQLTLFIFWDKTPSDIKKGMGDLCCQPDIISAILTILIPVCIRQCLRVALTAFLLLFVSYERKHTLRSQLIPMFGGALESCDSGDHTGILQ